MAHCFNIDNTYSNLTWMLEVISSDIFLFSICTKLVPLYFENGLKFTIKMKSSRKRKWGTTITGTTVENRPSDQMNSDRVVLCLVLTDRSIE